MTDAQDYFLADTPADSSPAGGRAVDREIPSDVAIERVLIGSVLLDMQFFNEISEVLTEQDFYLDSHVRIFKAMAGLVEAGSAVDTATLIAELRRLKELDTVGGSAFIFSLTESLPRRPVISDYIKLIRQKSQLRQMIQLFNVALTRAQDASETPLAILEDAESSLLQIAHEANTGKLRTIYDSVNDAGGMEPYIKACTDPETKPGLKTGFTEYDDMTGGLQKSELTILAARPSMGKTALAMNIAVNVAIDSESVVAVFSLEMARAALERRMMASRAHINLKRATAGWLGREEKVRLETALGHLVETSIFIDDSSMLTPVQLRAKARRLKQQQKRLDLIIVDYLQLMSAGSRTGSRQEEIALISRSLKACAKELEVPVMALSQLSRLSERRGEDKRPMLSDLRESGQIEQDADVVAFIHRPGYYARDEETPDNMAEIILAKQRHGATGIVTLVFIGPLTKFENLARE